MKRINHIITLISAVLFIGLMLLPISLTAKKPAPNPIVDCDAGQSIQVALDATKPGYPVALSVNGVCEEDVMIHRDDVIINGNNNTTVHGTIRIYGGSRVQIGNLTVTGSGHGIEVQNGRAKLYGLTIVNNELDGIWSIKMSNVVLNSSLVSGSRFGAFVQGSSFDVNDSEFTNNTLVGIQLDTGSNMIVRGSHIYGNGQGINNALHSVAEIEMGTEINSNSYGIYLAEDSGVRIDGPDVTINGNTISDIFCDDTESSYKVRFSATIGTTNCTDFNQVTGSP